MRRNLVAAPPLTALIQLGSEYIVETGVPHATYEDMTVAQALSWYEEWQRAPARIVRGALERQRQIYTQATACCVATRWVAESICGDYGIPQEKVHVVGIGRNQDLEPVERDWSTPRFLFVGREWERKNGPAVLRAFAEVRAHYPSATLDLVGHHPPVAQAGVVDHGFLTPGASDDQARLRALFASATCFVMPSRHEPAGIAYLEAGAAGVPSVGTTNGGAPELIGAGGVVVDPLDEAELIAALLKMADGRVAAETGGRALEHSALYTWEAVVRRILGALGVVAPEGVSLREVPL